MNLTEGLRFMATPYDRALLDAISRLDGDTSMSATIRRLIRDEARRRGIVVEIEPVENINEPNPA